ncbi:MAG: hypothetical protein HDT27_03600 [Subdoligranulum sp.]|nr:hypothetical protein [Subdoligranulum sp.]
MKKPQQAGYHGLLGFSVYGFSSKHGHIMRDKTAIDSWEALIKSTGQIDEQILRLPECQNRRNTWCTSRFWRKNRRKICRQDAPGDLFTGSLVISIKKTWTAAPFRRL